MSVILRIDVDRAYENRILHYRGMNQELFPGLDSLGYLKSCKGVMKDLGDRGIKASIFFQPFTMPNKEFDEELMKDGYSVGLHAVRTKGLKDFSRELGKMLKWFDGKVYGFTKQGSAVDHDDLERLSGYTSLRFVTNDVLTGVHS